jgi:hypothetical protein
MMPVTPTMHMHCDTAIKDEHKHCCQCEIKCIIRLGFSLLPEHKALQ